MRRLAEDTFSLLSETVHACVPDVRAAAFGLVTGKMLASPFEGAPLEKLRTRWVGLLPDPAEAAKGTGSVVGGFEDPDRLWLVDAEDSFATGVPLGVDDPLPRSPQVFPEKTKHRKLDDSDFNPIAFNYSSGQLFSVELEAKFREEEQLERMYPTRLSVLKEEFGEERVRVAAMAAIVKPDGSVRPLHDGTHSVQVNNRIVYQDQIQCPGPSEVAAVVCRLTYVLHTVSSRSGSVIGYQMRYDLNEIGVSLRRGEWLVKWIKAAETKKFVVVTRDFAEYLLAEFQAESFMVSAKRPLAFSGEQFRTDAKCTSDSVVLGGWELSSGRWFQVCLGETSAPYLFLPGKGAQWASTSAELLATLVALVAFGWTAEARSRKSLELHLVAGTDNRANEFLSRKRATTKEENTIADDITNSKFHQVDLAKRVDVRFEDIPTHIITSLFEAKADFDRAREAQRAIKRAQALQGGEVKRKRVEKTPW
ncbi:unnamed protein product [Durusdinium trenchii]|uniref:Uncharacterized protein n=1 Tax=Durusdinium trenchii TaxID=1381693 RepID=A0ABP0NFX2_9DINO